MDDPGFTLIEILTVIAIIALLAAVITVSVSGAQKRAQQSAAENQGRIVTLAVQEWLSQSPLRTTDNLSGQNCTLPATLTSSGLMTGYASGALGWSAPQTKMTCVISGTGRTFSVTTSALGKTYIDGE